ncbi:hypothetical protein AKJ08_3433 [Vulgatibacter incomptus]|uniref:CheW-like domain-containing protein n=1 Tax=Vulgatibacter incomptus TaxID=1391653 RepID=A0A0K1PI12_9BACT|nr:hypothetical protein AKJ08_3433 [Vulgatibacter incomptus]
MFTLPVAALREVAPPPAIASRIPRSAAPVLGAIQHRGRLAALVDLAGLLGCAAAGADRSEARMVLLERAAVGFLVDEVIGLAGDGEATPLAPDALVADVERLLGRRT